MKISIVIPVYNVSQYLEKCVNSVLRQTYHNLEIILVDDGSTDGSEIICDEFKEKHEEIIVIHKENGGLSDARNVGLEISSGDYLMFLDSDDYWQGDFLIKIVEKLNQNPNLDFVTSNGFIGVLPGGATISSICNFNKKKFIYENGEKFLEFVFTYKSEKGISWHWSAWQNVYRTSLLKENNLRFKKGIINEDAEWTPRVILAANNFDFYDETFYMYRLSRPDSITNICSPKKIKDYINIVDSWINYAGEMDNKNLAKIIKERFSNDLFYYMSYVYSFDQETREELIHLFQKSQFITYVTLPKYKKLVKKINNEGYQVTTKKMYKNFIRHELLKKVAVKLRLIDR